MRHEVGRQHLVALDVDQTLTKGLVKTHLVFYNEKLGLGMTAKQIEIADRKHVKTFDVPQIQEYRRQSKEADLQFERVRTEIRTSPEVHKNFDLIDNAQEGVDLLTNSGDFLLKGYYTVRPKELKGDTIQWLRKNQLPHPERVVICTSHEDKLRKTKRDVFLQERNRLFKNTNLVLIDDSLKQLAEAACLLAEKNPVARELIKRTIIVGFNIDEENKNRLLKGVIYPGLDFQTLSLPSWERSNVEELVRALQN